jgi:Flp pilus assembly protein TadG
MADQRLRRFWSRLVSRPMASLWRSDQAASAAEFAVIVPVLGLLLAGVMDLAQLANQGMLLKAGLRTAAGYAMVCPADDPDPIFNIVCSNTMVSAVTGSNEFQGTVDVTFPNAATGSGTAGYPQHCTCSDGSAIECGAAAVCDPGPKRHYITIRAVQTGLAPLLEWIGFPDQIERSLTVRVS